MKGIWKFIGPWLVRYMLDNMGEVELDLRTKWEQDGIPQDAKTAVTDLKNALIKAFLTI